RSFTSPWCTARKTATRTGSTMSTRDPYAASDPSWPERVEIYDTTLRDGSQLEGISLTVDDKLRIAEQLDWLGVHYIEAGSHGASRLVLCDTNGGTLPGDVERIVREVVTYFGGDTASGGVGIAVHLHDDAGTGVANALAGVRAGAIQVQGTINGYGERVGNCNLTTIIPNLTLKMGIETIPVDRLERLTPVAHHVAELVNMALNPQAPYVGSSAFAHKA